MTKIRDVLFFGALLATTSAHADQTTAFYRQPVYAVGPSMRICELMPSGVPSSLWGNNGRARVAEAVSPDGQTFTAVGTYDDGTQSVYRFFLHEQDCLAFMQSNATKPAADQNSEYVAKLESTFGKRLHFESNEAARIVQNFNIDCRAQDGRTLPLRNLLYARLASMDSKTAWLETFVQERGGEVRIIDSLRGPKIAPAPDTLAFEINKWGDLRPIGFRAEAVLNACFGSSGPIWRQ